MDPVFGPLLLGLLIVFYLAWRFGSDLWLVGALLGEKTLTGAAATAKAVGAKRLEAKAVAGASWLKDRRSRLATPRTRSGQRLSERLTTFYRSVVSGKRFGTVAAAAAAILVVLALLVRWLLVLIVDAFAAARSAQRRRTQADKSGTRRGWWPPVWLWTLPAWLKWPSGNDPEAPIYAHAVRLDREPETTPAVTQPAAPALPAPEIVDAEIVDEPAPTPAPIAPTPQLAITDGRNTHMSSYTAEGGLDAYIEHSSHMATECGNAANSADGTLNSMTSSGWSGAPVEAYQNAMQHLQAAQAEFNTANTALNAALGVRDAYNAHDHAGDKESVLN